MIAALLFGILLTLFLLVEALNVTLLKEPSFWLEQAGVLAGFAGVCLLVVDVALPVPSSLVMVAHGALFGVAVGTALSLVGSTGAALVGFAVGRRGSWAQKSGRARTDCSPGGARSRSLSPARCRSWLVGRWLEPRLIRAE